MHNYHFVSHILRCALKMDIRKAFGMVSFEIYPYEFKGYWSH
jgi:hypothetical protein